MCTSLLSTKPVAHTYSLCIRILCPHITTVCWPSPRVPAQGGHSCLCKPSWDAAPRLVHPAQGGCSHPLPVAAFKKEGEETPPTVWSHKKNEHHTRKPRYWLRKALCPLPLALPYCAVQFLSHLLFFPSLTFWVAYLYILSILGKEQLLIIEVFTPPTSIIWFCPVTTKAPQGVFFPSLNLISVTAAAKREILPCPLPSAACFHCLP